MKLSELTSCQRKCHKIYTKARRRGIPYTQMKEQLRTRYGVNSSAELTLEQYREILTQLDYLPIDKNAETVIIESQRKYYEQNKLSSLPDGFTDKEDYETE
jgi:hypothetical protein